MGATWELHMAVSILCAVHFVGLEPGIKQHQSLRLRSFTATWAVILENTIVHILTTVTQCDCLDYYNCSAFC